MSGPSRYLTFVYTKPFVADAKGLLSETTLLSLEQRLIADPQAGTVESGTGGIRKVRVAVKGKGRSGGARVVYFYQGAKGRIYFLLAFAKSERTSLSKSERHELAKLATELGREP